MINKINVGGQNYNITLSKDAIDLRQFALSTSGRLCLTGHFLGSGLHLEDYKLMLSGTDMPDIILDKHNLPNRASGLYKDSNGLLAVSGNLTSGIIITTGGIGIRVGKGLTIDTDGRLSLID